VRRIRIAEIAGSNPARSTKYGGQVAKVVGSSIHVSPCRGFDRVSHGRPRSSVSLSKCKSRASRTIASEFRYLGPTRRAGPRREPIAAIGALTIGDAFGVRLAALVVGARVVMAAVATGVKIATAARARVAEPEWSRRKSGEPFAWPNADGLDMSVVPAMDGTTESLFLYDLAEGRMALEGRDGARLECRFDKAVFPCCVYFASHGAMNETVTAVLEPCTTMPVSVNEAAERGFCSRLRAGEVMETTVTWVVSV
jgi:hypothetical protein